MTSQLETTTEPTTAAEPKIGYAAPPPPMPLPYYLVDKLEYGGRGSQWRWLLRTLDEQHHQAGVLDSDEAGFTLEIQTIYGRTPRDLARMRRMVALYVRLLGDLDGGFSNLASDEHLCVACLPQNWTMEMLETHRDLLPIPWELKPDYNRSCQIIRHSSVLNVMESRQITGKATVDLRTARTAAQIIEQIRDHLYGIGTERYMILDRLETLARTGPRDRQAFIAAVNAEPSLDITWVKSEGIDWR